MRKFLVRNFVGYHTYSSSHLIEIAIMFIIPVALAISFLTNTNYILAFCLFCCGVGLIFSRKNKKVSVLRASRVLYPCYAVIFSCYAKIQLGEYSKDLHDAALLVTLTLCAILFWLGFSGWGLSYWDLFPVKRIELDEEQLQNLKDAKIKLKMPR